MPGLSKKDSSLSFTATIRLLDDNSAIECEFQRHWKGADLLDLVYSELNLLETDYFGLRFVDHQKQRHWLDPKKNILRQIKHMNPIQFCFRVKFYPANPLKMKEEISRYYLFLQLRRDLLHGRLYCSHNDAIVLGAYIVQADYGDSTSTDPEENHVADYKIFLRQNSSLEKKIFEVQRTLSGLTPSAAESYFLKKASNLDTYGVDPYSVKDQKGVQLYLGLNYGGILTFEGSKRTHYYKWSEVQKLNYEGKMFIVHWNTYDESRNKLKHTVGFKCSSAVACRDLWRTAVEQRLFYTMENSKHGTVVTGGSFFSRGSKFRFEGRCEKEIIEESSKLAREPPTVKRIPLKNVARSASLPTTPADPKSFDANSVMSKVHRTLPYIDRSTSLDEDVLCETESPTSGFNSANLDPGTYSALPSLPEDAEKKFDESSAANGARYTIPHNACECDSPRLHFDIESSTSSDTLGPPTEPIGERYSPEQSIQSSNPKFSPMQEKGEGSLNKYSPKPCTKSGLIKNLANTKINPVFNHHNPELHKTPTHKTPKKNPLTNLLNLKLKSKSIFASNVLKFSQIFITTFIIVSIILAVFTVFAFEADFEPLSTFVSSHEMVLLRVQYYEPFKNYLKHFYPLNRE